MAINKRKTGRNLTGVEINAGSNFSILDSECKRIVNEAKQGNCLKALNLMSVLCSKYKNSPYEAFVSRVQGDVFVNVACRSYDLKDRKRYYENAVESAKRAVDLSPNVIEFALFYANLLYEVANEGRDYEEVMCECARALAIVDPILESQQDQCNENYRTELRSLIQRSNIALVSTWMRKLGNEERKFEFMPVRRIFDDKNVEDQVAYMLFLLNQSPRSRVCNGVNNSSRISKGPVVGSLERRKQGDVGRSVTLNEMMEWVRPFWNSMSLERKKDFLNVKIADLQQHIMSLKEQLPSNLIVEALSFCKEKKEWHFMICCNCNKQISDTEEFKKHTELVHLERMPLKHQLVFPKNVENDWVEMICHGCWKPLDLNAAVMVLEERLLDFVDKESLLREKWPIAHDSQREELLDEIHAILDSHVKLQYLSESHINIISNYAVMALQKHPQLLRLNVHQTHLCICFLGAQELLNILKVLQEIADYCEHNIYSGASSAGIYDSNNLAQDVFIEQLGFSQEDSVVVSIYDRSRDNSPETDALLFSMYAESSKTEELPACPPFEYLIEEKAQQGLQIIQQLESDFKRMKASIEKKLELLGNQDALPVVGYLCAVARTDFQCQTPLYESVLRNRKEELIKTGTTVSDDIFELNALSCVLDEVESLGPDEVDESRVREAIQRHRNKFAVEIRKMDARIMSIHAKRIHLLQEHASVATHDFRIIITPLLKYFLRARLEDLKKKAIEDELILDSKCSVGSGVDNPKLISERKKNSKREKRRQKNSGPKVTNCDNSLDKIAKEILPPDDRVEESPSSEVVASSNNDDAVPDTDCHDLNLREEELKRKLELEAEERKLEEALELQRQMEYEAKQKSIANQPDCSSPAIRQEEIEIASEGEQLEQALQDQQQTKDGALQKHHVEQHMDKNDEFHNISEGAADYTMDGCKLVIGSVNTGVILTDSEQQPVCGKAPSHDSEATTGVEIVDVFHFSADSGVYNSKLVGRRKNHWKKRTKRRTNSGPKVTNSYNSLDETAEEILLPDEKCPDTDMAPDTDYHDLQLEEENEKQIQETLEYQRHVEHEAKQNTLANKEEVSSTKIRQEEVEITCEVEQIKKTLEECSKGQYCFICKKQGHLVKNCPEKNSSRYCLKCGDYGHDMFSCRNEYSAGDLKQVQCYICNKFGHLCCVDYGSPRKGQVSCYRCGDSGHTGPECCMQNDKFQDTSKGAADNTTDGCTFSNGSVNRGVILTDNQQESVREKEPSHGNKEPTSRHDSLVDHNGYVKKGTVKWFNNQKGFGFITPEDGTCDLFVHYSSIKSDGYFSLGNGESVEYQVGVGDHSRPKAINVTGPDGAPVQGSSGESGGGGYGGGYGGRSGGSGGRGRCYTFGDSGHVACDCMQRSGGDGYGCGYGGRSGIGSGRGQCYACGDSGHMVYDCMQHNGGVGGGKYGGGGRGGCGDSIPLKKRPETSDAANEAIIKVNGMVVSERGLRIVLVEHNSFPSVIIQSLWHIRRFRDDEQRLSVHAHVDDPFVGCALCDILVAQNSPSVNKERETHPLTVAIRKTVSCFFNKGPMDDASEVLEIILTNFHQVLTPSQDVSVTESVDSNRFNSSINLFKLDVIERMRCYHCGLTSRFQKYTSFFHKINANDLRKAKLLFPTYSFDELLNLVDINHHLACDPKASGCGALNHIEHDLSTSPHVFTAFIEWQNNSGICEDINQILEAICTSIDVRLLYRGLNTEHRHHLVCMVCYYGQHYCSFGYNEEGKWILHDDKTIKMLDGWKDVVAKCKTENMKPHVLFYEAVY